LLAKFTLKSPPIMTSLLGCLFTSAEIIHKEFKRGEQLVLIIAYVVLIDVFPLLYPARPPASAVYWSI
jgi:hypothetical protein